MSGGVWISLCCACMNITAAPSRDWTQIYTVYKYKIITRGWTALLFLCLPVRRCKWSFHHFQLWRLLEVRSYCLLCRDFWGRRLSASWGPPVGWWIELGMKRRDVEEGQFPCTHTHTQRTHNTTTTTTLNTQLVWQNRQQHQISPITEPVFWLHNWVVQL